MRQCSKLQLVQAEINALIDDSAGLTIIDSSNDFARAEDGRDLEDRW
jgi:hypothetical protein